MSDLLNHRNNDTTNAALDTAAGRQPDFVLRALEAALARTSDQKAWALVRLAADLRAVGRPAVALSVLDEAFFLGHKIETDRAMFSSAIGAHCDLGQHPVGKVVERDWVKQGDPDLKFAKAALRLYTESFLATGDPHDDLLCAHYRTLVESLADVPELDAKVLRAQPRS
jgi:hypothetical protein